MSLMSDDESKPITPSSSLSPSRESAQADGKALQMLIREDTESDKEQLITQILDLQEALLATLRRVETARSDNVRIAGENATLLQYINNMMSATGPPNESVAKAIKAQPKRS